jgi:hypothetical protein
MLMDQEKRTEQTNHSMQVDQSVPMRANNGLSSFQYFQAGARDYLFDVTVKSVLLKTDEHIVFLDEYTNLYWHCSGDQELRRLYPKTANRVASLAARSEFLRRAHSSNFVLKAGTDVDLTNARWLIAQGVIQVFVGKKTDAKTNEDHADEVLNTAEAWINQRAIEVSRLWYFRPFGFLFVASLVVLLLFLTFGLNPHFAWALPYACIAAGGVGAFVSSAIGHARVPSAASAGKRLHALEAAMRWSVGLGSGAFVFIVSKSSLVNLVNFAQFLPPEATLKQDRSHFAILALALLAGASEQLFPSLIKKLDDPAMGRQKP